MSVYRHFVVLISKGVIIATTNFKHQPPYWIIRERLNDNIGLLEERMDNIDLYFEGRNNNG